MRTRIRTSWDVLYSFIVKSFVPQTICVTIYQMRTKRTLKNPKVPQIEIGLQPLGRKIRMPSGEVKLHPVLEKHLGYCLYKAALKFRSMIDQMMAKEGLIAPQFGVLTIRSEERRV